MQMKSAYDKAIGPYTVLPEVVELGRLSHSTGFIPINYMKQIKFHSKTI